MNTFEKKRILVVGGAGFVGSNLVETLLQDSPEEIVIVDNLLSSEITNVPVGENVTFIQGSIADDAVLDGLEDTFDYVFHLATFHGNQNSIADPLADHENNTLTTLKLFHRIRSFKKVKKIVYSSAGCTVAKKTFEEAVPTTEDAPVSLYLDSPYQISKIIGEFYANYYFRRYQLPVVKARFQNVYGPKEILGAGQWRGTPATVWRNVTPTFIYRAMKGMPLMVENEGIATRDFIYVKDIVKGLMLCALKGVSGGVYNLASGAETSILKLAEIIKDITKSSSEIQIGPRRDWDNSGRRYGSTDKSRRELGFNASIELRKGLEKTIGWTYKNIELIDKCIKKHQNYLQS